MNRLPVILLSLFCFLGLLRAATYEFERYRVIMDKQIFGKPRPAPKPVSTPSLRPTPPPVNWAKDYQLTMMTRSRRTGKVEIGLQHVKGGNSYLLREGQSSGNTGGFSLIRTDYDQKIAIVAYQGTQHQFTQEMGTVQVAAKKETAGKLDPRNQSRNRLKRPPRRVPVRQMPTAQPVPKLQGAALDAHLQNYNEEVIRKGLPPLPIPLTPEQDARLVREGFLPPQ